MVDITQKSNTLRTAIAQAIVKVSSQETIDAIRNQTVPKGDVFAMSKAAGLLAVKKHPTYFQTVIHYLSNIQVLNMRLMG